LSDPLLRYFDAVDKAIASSGWADISEQKLIIPPDRFKPNEEIFWDFKVVFPPGPILTAVERHRWNEKGQHYRKIRYMLMNASSERILQVDTHRDAIPFEDYPHIHIGPGEGQRVFDGDPRLKGHSLRDFDFLKMWKWVQDYLEDWRLPWQR
jgi:hypothetical protein